MTDLLCALCLVAVLEGLWLFAAPGMWKRAISQLLEMPERQLRAIGGVVLIVGLISLYLVRG